MVRLYGIRSISETLNNCKFCQWTKVIPLEGFTHCEWFTIRCKYCGEYTIYFILKILWRIYNILYIENIVENIQYTLY